LNGVVNWLNVSVKAIGVWLPKHNTVRLSETGWLKTSKNE